MNKFNFLVVIAQNLFSLPIIFSGYWINWIMLIPNSSDETFLWMRFLFVKMYARTKNYTFKGCVNIKHTLNVVIDVSSLLLFTPKNFSYEKSIWISQSFYISNRNSKAFYMIFDEAWMCNFRYVCYHLIHIYFI